MWFSYVLTWTLPLGAALVSVHQHGEAQQATIRWVGGKGAALGLVEEDQLVVDADILCAFVNNLCVWRLERENVDGSLNNSTTHGNISTTRSRFYRNPFFNWLFVLFWR